MKESCPRYLNSSTATKADSKPLIQSNINDMMRTTYFELTVALAAFCSVAYGKDIYVSPSGSGSGSQTAPYGSIQSAVNAAVAGDTIFLRAGTYKPTANVQITKSGTRTSPITLRSYQSEKVVIDGEALPGYERRGAMTLGQR